MRWSNGHLSTAASSDRFQMNGRYDNDLRCNQLLEDFRALRSQVETTAPGYLEDIRALRSKVETTTTGHSFPRPCHEKHFATAHRFKAGVIHSRPKSWASSLDRQYLV